MAKKIDKKTRTVVALDSMVFIYHFENNPKFFEQTKKIFTQIEKGHYLGISSVITILEILTYPKRKKDYLLVKEYNETLKYFPNLKFIDINWEIVDLASSIRAKYNLTSPDALQIGTAIYTGAKYFFTADEIFKRVKEIKVRILK